MMLLGVLIILGVVLAGGLLVMKTAHLDRAIDAELRERDER